MSGVIAITPRHVEDRTCQQGDWLLFAAWRKDACPRNPGRRDGPVFATRTSRPGKTGTGTFSQRDEKEPVPVFPFDASVIRKGRMIPIKLNMD